jgi:hypothetical protein
MPRAMRGRENRDRYPHWLPFAGKGRESAVGADEGYFIIFSSSDQ